VRRLPAAVVLVACVSLGAIAHADPGLTLQRPAPRRHAAYLELLGKGGLWGIGYDFQYSRWLGGGVAGSFYVLDGQRVSSLSPYLAIEPLGSGHHRWFVHAGPQLYRVATPSPVPEWSGTSSTGLGAALSTGYEYRNHLLVRVFAMGVAGKHGVAPWLGASLGWSW